MNLDSKKNINQNENLNSTKKIRRGKLSFILIIVYIGILALIIRLVQLQIIEHPKWKERARRQHEARVPLRAERGNIYDRNGNLLAASIECLSFACDPTLMKDSTARQKICLKISQAFPDLKYQDLYNKIILSTGSFVWLLRGILPTESHGLDTIRESGFIIAHEPRRSYIYGNDCGQVVGTTDTDNKGLCGIELGLDSILSGTAGYMMMWRDAAGRLRPSADLPAILAVAGASVELTIDIDLQRILEYELSSGVKKSEAASGTAVAMDPSTGEILAMATEPGFNPNNPSIYAPSLMRNRAITDIYEPGSTFKLITAAAALEERLIKPDDQVDGGNGRLEIYDYTITDHEALGKATFQRAFEVSSNIVFSGIGAKLPSNKFYKYLRDFNFGLTLGVDLPGELDGNIKNPEEYDETTRRFVSFGYGVSATPLQVLSAYATIANSGGLMKPYVIKKIKNSSGETLIENNPEKIRKVVGENTCNILTKMLCGVVDNGTGKNAKIPGIKIAGKTGTSQQLVESKYSKQDYNSSFVGFFPAENPKLVLLILLDKPRGDYYGGAAAAPIFKSIAERWIATNTKQNIINNSFSNNNFLKIINIKTPDVRGMTRKDAERLLKTYGLNSRCISSSGDNSPIIYQTPTANSNINSSGIVELITASRLQEISNSEDYNLIWKQRTNVVGMTLRRAITILRAAGISFKIEGDGLVSEQKWDYSKKNNPVCVLVCR